MGLFIAIVERHKGALLGGAVAAVLCLGSAGLGWLLEHFPRKPLVQLSSSRPALILFANKPTAAAVQAFQAALEKTARQYLRQAYGAASGGAVEAIERLFALLNQGAISQEEFQQLKAKLLGTSSGSPDPGQYL